MSCIAVVAAALLLSPLTSAPEQEITAAECTACQAEHGKY